MDIVKKHGFRSQGRGINQTDDMCRVMIDMSKREYLELERYLARQVKGSHRAQTNNSVSPKLPASCGECQLWCLCGGFVRRGDADCLEGRSHLRV